MSQSDVAIITGASGGIGRAIAEAMLAAGRRVVSLDRRVPDWSHPMLEPIVVDLFDPKATAVAAADVAARHAVSHVVHNAGVIRPNLDRANDTRRHRSTQSTPSRRGADSGAGRAARYEAAPFRTDRLDRFARSARRRDPHRLFGNEIGHVRNGPHLGAGDRSLSASRSIWWHPDRSRPTCSTRSFRKAARKWSNSPARFRLGGSAGRTTWPGP